MENQINPQSPVTTLMSYVVGFWRSRLVNAVTELNIASYLNADGKTPIEEIAKASKCDTEYLYRAMRCLAAQGVFKDNGDRTFSHSPMSLLLLDQSMRDIIMFEAGETTNHAWSTVKETIQTGKSQAGKAFGVDTMWDYYTSHPEDELKFKKAMSGFTKPKLAFYVSIADFSPYEVVCDLGGSEGLLINSILNKYPTIKQGINFDLPSVIENNIKLGVVDNGRFTQVSGSFLDAVPKANCYTLKSILHDWNDESCVKILKCIGKSIAKGGKVFVFDRIVEPSHPNYPFFVLMDTHMMQVVNGKERTKSEWEQLASQSGFVVDQFVETDLVVLKLKE